MICFHNPNEENGYLSNWYLSDFTVDGKRFSSAEQYMMYSKAAMFGDSDMAEKIMSTDDVGKIKYYGRCVKNFDDTVWVSRREETVYKGVLQKFLQNPELAKKLLDTGEQTIAECAVHDRIWGIGLSMQDENRFNTKKWEGLNLLGRVLMRVRSELKGTL